MFCRSLGRVVFDLIGGTGTFFFRVWVWARSTKLDQLLRFDISSSCVMSLGDVMQIPVENESASPLLWGFSESHETFYRMIMVLAACHACSTRNA